MGESDGRLPSKQEFATAVHSRFQAANNNGLVFDLLLETLDEAVSSETHENFSLIFRGPADAHPSQGLYSLKHDKLGEMDIFLVPIKKDQTWLYFEAVFNRPKGA